MTNKKTTLADIAQPQWYTGIATLPLNKFIDVAVDGNLAALIISGIPSAEDLELAWKDISYQFADKAGDGETKLYRSLYKEIQVTNITLEQVTLIISTLTELADHDAAKDFIADWAKKLNGLLRTNFAFDPGNKEQYHAELKRASNRSKAIKIDLDLKNLRFKALEEKQKSKGESKGYTREYFQSVLITLSDHAKYQIQDSITVSEYCIRLQRFNSYCEQMQKHYKK